MWVGFWVLGGCFTVIWQLKRLVEVVAIDFEREKTRL
jgi:hypothetical protein